MRLALSSLGLILLLAGPVAAQTVVNPTAAQFTASADHNTILGGVPVLSGYRLETNIYTTQLGALQFSLPLGKPTPAAGNVITVVVAQFSALPNGSYESRVFAVGPGGEAATPFTSPFVKLGPPAAATNLLLVP